MFAESSFDCEASDHGERAGNVVDTDHRHA